jgi:hypothetical protein
MPAAVIRSCAVFHAASSSFVGKPTADAILLRPNKRALEFVKRDQRNDDSERDIDVDAQEGNKASRSRADSADNANRLSEPRRRQIRLSVNARVSDARFGTLALMRGDVSMVTIYTH